MFAALKDTVGKLGSRADAEAAGQWAFDFAASPPAKTADAVERRLETEDSRLPEVSGHEVPPFGEWLLSQRERRGWVGELARAFKADRNFPKRGTPDDVRRYMRDLRAEGDAYEALDDAELSWASL